MPNSWVEHIKKYTKDNNFSYGCALSTPECKNTYVKSTPQPKSKIKNVHKKPEKKPHTMYDKPVGPVKPTKPHTIYKKPIGIHPSIHTYKYIICMSSARTPTQQGGEAKGFSLLMPATH